MVEPKRRIDMEPLDISLSTFLKISASKPRGQITIIRSLLAPGGYDFYKVLKRLAGQIARKEISLAQAELEVAKIKQSPERTHTLELIRKFHSWFSANGQQWSQPPKAKYTSTSGLLKLRLNPEVAFVNSNGGTTALALWNTAAPALGTGVAAEGIQCLVNEIKPLPADEIGILHVRKRLVFDKTLVSPGSQARLSHNLMLVEEIWKDLHDPGMGAEDVVSHIMSIGAAPPAP